MTKPATLKCISPVDGTLFAERPVMETRSVAGTIEGMRAAQKDWAALPLDERIRVVLEGVGRLTATQDEAVVELARMMGRPIRYGGEFGGVTERAEYMAGIAGKALAPLEIEDSEAFRRMVLREPQGIVLVVAPWNYPYLTAINTVVPALIAGNAVALKHATQTLLAGERLVQCLHEAGIPEDVLVNLFLDHSGTETLIAAGCFDFVNFTGSVEGGRAMERAAAGTFTGMGLELGGKDPGYVMEDADLDWSVDVLMDGAMYNSGQCCCGIERIYVAAPRFNEFVEKACEWTNRLELGNPLDPETTLGPMASPRFAANARAQIAEAVRDGAQTRIDPGDFPQDDGGAYLMPQILTGVNHQMRVMREETFGPVVGIMPVKNDEEAIALMNDSPYGLTASLWTEDTDRALAIGRRIETGTVFMNRADYLDPALCWTGCKETGRGGALSEIGYHNLTRPKSYHLRKRRA
jgi:acyl-CoA reductase-like NAD-dependent aldehyde dehydrogenase